MLKDTEAKLLAEAYLSNVRAQSLAVLERKVRNSLCLRASMYAAFMEIYLYAKFFSLFYFPPYVMDLQLCFEVLQCLLDTFPDAIKTLVSDFCF